MNPDLTAICQAIADLDLRIEQLEALSTNNHEVAIGLTFWDEPELPFSSDTSTWPSGRTGGRLSDANG